MQMLLETDRLILRQFVSADVENLFTLDSDPEVVQYTPNAGQTCDRALIQTQTLPQFLQYYETYNGYGIWAAIEKSSQEFIGWFLFRPVVHATYFDPNLAHPDDIELGYRLRKASWGKGYATEGAKALLLKGFAELGTQRVIAVALSVNIASIRVLEKVGLQLQTKFFYPPLQQEIAIYKLERSLS